MVANVFETFKFIELQLNCIKSMYLKIYLKHSYHTKNFVLVLTKAKSVFNFLFSFFCAIQHDFQSNVFQKDIGFVFPTYFA